LPSPYLDDIDFAGAIGYAVGSGGRVLRTTNWGASWTEETTPTTNTLEAIAVVDENHATAAGYDGTILGLNASPPTGTDNPPVGRELFQNYPNPFNPQTTIRYNLTDPARVTLRVYSPSGRLVRTLVDGWRGAGTWSVEWDGTNNAGARVASGVYFYQLRAGPATQTKKMTLLK
jgi:hypothetical protein